MTPMPLCLGGLGVWGLGFRVSVSGLGFRVEGQGLGVYGLEVYGV